MARLTGADDGDVYGGVRECPRDGQLTHRDVMVGREDLLCSHGREVAAVGVTAEDRTRAAPIIVGEDGVRVQRSGQQPVASGPYTSTPMSCSRQYGSISSSISRRNRWYGGCSVSTGRVSVNSRICAAA